MWIWLFFFVYEWICDICQSCLAYDLEADQVDVNRMSEPHIVKKIPVFSSTYFRVVTCSTWAELIMPVEVKSNSGISEIRAYPLNAQALGCNVVWLALLADVRLGQIIKLYAVNLEFVFWQPFITRRFLFCQRILETNESWIFLIIRFSNKVNEVGILTDLIFNVAFFIYSVEHDKQFEPFSWR